MLQTKVHISQTLGQEKELYDRAGDGWRRHSKPREAPSPIVSLHASQPVFLQMRLTNATDSSHSPSRYPSER